MFEVNVEEGKEVETSVMTAEDKYNATEIVEEKKDIEKCLAIDENKITAWHSILVFNVNIMSKYLNKVLNALKQSFKYTEN